MRGFNSQNSSRRYFSIAMKRPILNSQNFHPTYELGISKIFIHKNEIIILSETVCYSNGIGSIKSRCLNFWVWFISNSNSLCEFSDVNPTDSCKLWIKIIINVSYWKKFQEAPDRSPSACTWKNNPAFLQQVGLLSE